ncbi:MAG: hypothetical protein HY049_00635 [Acidobacteria bacterium]|nr:hypothetical protein [Acidobacteriota bacterium]
MVYLIGGSLASSLNGEPRSSVDVDIVAALTRTVVDRFVAELRGEFYADAEVIRRAVDDRASANIIHMATTMKVDLFVAGGTPLDAEQLARRRRALVAANPDRFLYVYAPEDILLQKLRWFRMGGETSDKQWRDILGIIRVQNRRLDVERLRKDAAVLGVTDLLERAMRGEPTS